MLSAWTKKPPTPDVLMGEKPKAGTQDVPSLIREMKAKAAAEEKAINIDTEANGTDLDLYGEAPVDDWYWGSDGKLDE